MKKLLSIALILVMIFTFAACGGDDTGANGDEGEAVTLVLGGAASGDTNPYIMNVQWANEWLEENGSNIKIEANWGSVLGSETELAQNVALGTVDMFSIADMSTTGIAPKMAFANFPGLFADYDAVNEAWKQGGWAYDLTDKTLAESGVKLIGCGDNGFRIISNSKHPVKSLDDIKGLKIRCPENKLLLEIWDKFGAQTAPIALGDLTAALQTKTVDGQELGVQHFYSFGWVEFNKYLTQLNYNYSTNVIGMNMDKFNSLTEKQQSDLLAAFEYSTTKMRDYVQEFEANAIEEMKGEGLEYLEATDEMKEQFVEIGKEIAHEDEWMSLLGEDLVNQMYPEA
ncbi:MAG: TRAP transporter substrate-binding protein [Anaerobutyricum sp.]|nr:TRAP transporter substrate-binding protein [Anaerobutyricum sp.]